MPVLRAAAKPVLFSRRTWTFDCDRAIPHTRSTRGWPVRGETTTSTSVEAVCASADRTHWSSQAALWFRTGMTTDASTRSLIQGSISGRGPQHGEGGQGVPPILRVPPVPNDLAEYREIRVHGPV